MSQPVDENGISGTNTSISKEMTGAYVGEKDADYYVEQNLQNWKDWMHAGGGPDGCPKKACGGVRGYTNMDLDNVAAYESLDASLAERTHAAIDDLSAVESCAIYHRYLHAVFRFQRETLDEALTRARENLKAGLRRRNVWLGD